MKNFDKIGKLLIYWDYELQTGADQAISTKGKWNGNDDYEQTELLLSLLKEYGLQTTFAVVGFCAEKGDLPYHAPNQIKRIFEQGHEIASHSYKHEYIPWLTLTELRRTLVKSKQILEELTGQKVFSFTAPHNQPVNFHGLALEFKKRIGLSKVSLGRLYDLLSQAGYRTHRDNYWTPVNNKLFGRFRSFPMGFKGNLRLFRLNCSDGFGRQTRQVVNHAVKTRQIAVICGHPWALKFKGDQSMSCLIGFLEWVKKLEQNKKLIITTPRALLT